MNYELSGKRLAIVAIILAGATGLAWLLSRETEVSLPQLEKPSLVVKKGKRQLQVFDGGKLVKTYKIAIGSNPSDDKQIEGDGRTPEGDFYLAVKNPASRFHRSLGLSYPNIEDAMRGLRENLIANSEHDEIVRAITENRLPPQNTALGGEIYIHGGGTEKDWTRGCIALENNEMQELFDALPYGISVTIEK
ncbi:MAG: L,D-transpeptidase family protein [Pyrinomonadaceae bacterium]